MKPLKHCLFLLIVFFSPPLFAVEYQDEIVSLALEGQKKVFERNYDDALTFFKRVEKDHPFSPLGPFGQMAVFEMRMLEREDFHLEKEFLETARRGEEAAGKVMQRYNPSDVDLLFCASLYGIEGFFRARKGQWWGAYLKGTLSRQIFSSIQKKNPDFADARFGLGMYLYWRSVFTKEIPFLPFFSDRRKEGIEIIEGVAKDGIVARDLARVNLGVIYLEEKKFADAVRVFEEYLNLYPKNILLRQLLGRTFLADKKFGKAVEQFRQISAIDSKIAKANYFVGMALVLEGKKENFDEAERRLKNYLADATERLWKSYALYWLGTLYEKRGDKLAAAGYFREAIRLNRGLKSAKIKLRGLGGGI